MSRIVSVDKSFGADGRTRHFVTIQQENGARQRVEVQEAEAEQFLKSMQENHNRPPRLLTEA